MWLREQTAEQPFFLYLAQRNIHSPQRCNERFKGKSELGAYGDFILEMDWSVGEVLKALDEKGLTQNTLVFFSSDNGGVARYKPTYSASIDGHKVNGPLRGQKTDAYEGGHRVPLIARWPGMVPPHTEDSSLIALTDMLATFADFFGVQLPDNAGEDSFSFLGALLGEKPRQIIRNAIVNDGFSGVFAIRRADWKLILSQHGGGAGMLNAPDDPSKPAGQLYHLGRDIGESKNEYDQHPEIVKSLSDLLEQYKQTGRSAPKYRSARPREGVD
jgi:arylsulfatase A-like enzyme